MDELEDIENQMREAEGVINHVYEVIRQILERDLKVQFKEEILKTIANAGFDNDSLNTLYNYCLEKESYEACEVIQPFLHPFS